MLIGVDSHAVGKPGTGNCTYVKGLLMGLSSVDINNSYILYDTAHRTFYSGLGDRFNVSVLRSPHGLFRYFASLPVALAARPVDVLHVQYILPVGFTARSVVTIHDLYFEHYPQHYSLAERAFMRWAVRRSAVRADVVITDSQYSKRDLERRYRLPHDKVVVIPLGVESRFNREQSAVQVGEVRRKYGISGSYVLYVGRTDDPRKNLSLLIDAYSDLVLGSGCNCQLVIAGKHGPATRALIAKARRLRRGCVLFPGLVSDDDVPALISGAAVFVYPSFFEGFGLPVLEAMACGTPVVTSNVTSLPEVAGDAALVIDPRERGDLTEALLRCLVDDDLRRRMRERGLEWSAKYTWQRTGHETLMVYDQACFGRKQTTLTHERITLKRDRDHA